jgi:hypothetical protein
MGMALAYKRGDIPASEVSDKVKQLAKTMTMKELEKYASTKHKGIPTKVMESRSNLPTFVDFMREKEEASDDVDVETANDVDVEMDIDMDSDDNLTGDETMVNVVSKTPMKPNKHSYEWSEPESKMMQYQLKNIIENAEELIQMIEGVDEIEDWVQAKVTLADDYISTLRDYMKHRD